MVASGSRHTSHRSTPLSVYTVTATLVVGVSDGSSRGVPGSACSDAARRPDVDHSDGGSSSSDSRTARAPGSSTELGARAMGVLGGKADAARLRRQRAAL